MRTLSLSLFLLQVTTVLLERPLSCPTGHSLSKLTQHENKKNEGDERMFTFKHECRSIEPKECLGKCQWLPKSCRSDPGWESSAGDRIYLAGFSIFDQDGKYSPLFYCCESIGTFLYDDCYWITVPVDEPFEVLADPTTIIGDMVSFSVYGDINVQVELCKFAPVTGPCDREEWTQRQKDIQRRLSKRPNQQPKDKTSAEEIVELAVGLGVGIGVGVGVPLGVLFPPKKCPTFTLSVDPETTCTGIPSVVVTGNEDGDTVTIPSSGCTINVANEDYLIIGQTTGVFNVWAVFGTAIQYTSDAVFTCKDGEWTPTSVTSDNNGVSVKSTSLKYYDCSNFCA